MVHWLVARAAVNAPGILGVPGPPRLHHPTHSVRITLSSNESEITYGLGAALGIVYSAITPGTVASSMRERSRSAPQTRWKVLRETNLTKPRAWMIEISHETYKYFKNEV
jgi:hypothetical protein